MSDVENIEIWYMAHPVGAADSVGVEANLARARRWLRWLLDHEPDVAIAAPWMPYLAVVPEHDAVHRARGLRDDCVMAARCDGIVLVGGRITDGMRLELDAVIASEGMVADLTSLGEEPGEDPPDEGVWSRREPPLAFGCRQWVGRDDRPRGTRP